MEPATRRTTRFNRSLALVPVLLLLLAGCGVAVAPSVTHRASSPSPAARTSSPSERTGGAPNPSVGADQELERRLPDQVGTEILRKLSLNGTQYFAGAGAGANDFRDVLTTVGKTPEDFTIALAVSTNVKVGAFRVRGINSAVLLPAYLQAGVHNTPGSTVADDSVAGKSVKKVVIPNQPDVLYLYANGDALFFAQATSPALLTEALSKIT
jgi:hypothetical protein